MHRTCLLSKVKRTCLFALHTTANDLNLPLGCRVFGHSKRDDYSATMRYMIAGNGDCPFCKAILHHAQTRHAPTLPRDKITRVDPRRPTDTAAGPLTGDESDDALLRMPFKEARVAAIDAFVERYVLHPLPLPHDGEARHRLQRVKRA